VRLWCTDESREKEQTKGEPPSRELAGAGEPASRKKSGGRAAQLNPRRLKGIIDGEHGSHRPVTQRFGTRSGACSAQKNPRKGKMGQKSAS